MSNIKYALLVISNAFLAPPKDLFGRAREAARTLVSTLSGQKNIPDGDWTVVEAPARPPEVPQLNSAVCPEDDEWTEAHGAGLMGMPQGGSKKINLKVCDRRVNLFFYTKSKISGFIKLVLDPENQAKFFALRQEIQGEEFKDAQALEIFSQLIPLCKVPVVNIKENGEEKYCEFEYGNLGTNLTIEKFNEHMTTFIERMHSDKVIVTE